MVNIRAFEIIWIDEAEQDLEELPLSLQATAIRKLEQTVQRNFKTADRLVHWPGEFRRLRLDDTHRLVFYVDREQATIVILSIDPRDDVYEQPSKQHINKLLEQALDSLGIKNPMLKIGKMPEPKMTAPPPEKGK